MKVEPNLVLAFSTLMALTLLVLTAGVFGRPDFQVRYALMAVGFTVAYVMLNTFLERRAPVPPPPMIAARLVSIPLAMAIPVLILAFAAVPVFLPGRDVALLVIIGTVLFGVTIRSAMRVKRAET